MNTTIIWLVVTGVIFVIMIGCYLSANNILSELKNAYQLAHRNRMTVKKELAGANDILRSLIKRLIDNQQYLGQQAIHLQGTLPNYRPFDVKAVRFVARYGGYNQLTSMLRSISYPPGPESKLVQNALADARVTRAKVVDYELVYNQAVCRYNNYRNRFPAILAAGIGNFPKASFDDPFKDLIDGPDGMPETPEFTDFYPRTPDSTLKNGQVIKQPEPVAVGVDTDDSHKEEKTEEKDE